jgi:hypothetical protein
MAQLTDNDSEMEQTAAAVRFVIEVMGSLIKFLDRNIPNWVYLMRWIIFLESY